MAMNQRRWIGVVLSTAWLAGVAGYEIAELRLARNNAYAAFSPLCEQVNEAARTRCLVVLAHISEQTAMRHAIEIVVLAALACALGWVAGLIVVKRLPGAM